KASPHFFLIWGCHRPPPAGYRGPAESSAAAVVRAARAPGEVRVDVPPFAADRAGDDGASRTAASAGGQQVLPGRRVADALTHPSESGQVADGLDGRLIGRPGRAEFALAHS